QNKSSNLLFFAFLVILFQKNAAYACENRCESVFLMFCFCMAVFVTATAYGLAPSVAECSIDLWEKSIERV
ncbi:hypothetical protein, partial [Hallella sp.]|uniref:hypothetical protein n=1 Tax=Hallella sp. TaxID=2980186 RepID=UPI003078AD44